MRKHFDEHQTRNDFLKLIEGQPGKVQMRICMMALMQVLHRIDADEANAELQELTELLTVGGDRLTEH